MGEEVGGRLGEWEEEGGEVGCRVGEWEVGCRVGEWEEAGELPVSES